MFRYVVKCNKKLDLYMCWDSEVEGPIWAGSREKLQKDIRTLLPTKKDAIDQLIDHIDKHGTSSFDERYGGWSGKGFGLDGGSKIVLREDFIGVAIRYNNGMKYNSYVRVNS